MKKRRILPVLLSLLLVASMAVPMSFAMEFSDISGSWAKDIISEWAGYGVINGYPNGTFQPEGNITRAELAKILNTVIAYTETGANPFTDVETNDWFYDHITKLQKAGVMKGTNAAGTLASPNSLITRQEATVLIARAFGIAENEAAADAFKDASQIDASWAKGLVGGMVNEGYISGYPDGSFMPKSNLTREETVKILDNMVDAYYSESKEYTGDVEGNVLVNKSGAVIKDATLGGNLYITEGVGNGDVTLDGVNVQGKLIVRGGGQNSIVITGDSTIGELIVTKTENGAVRVHVESGSTVNVMYIEDGKDAVIIDGDIEKLVVSSPAEVIVSSGTIQEMVVNANNADVTVNKDAEVTGAVINANDANIGGEGKLGSVHVESGTGNVVMTADTTITVSENAGAVTAGEKEILPGETGNTSNPDDPYVPPVIKSAEIDMGSITISEIEDMSFIVFRLTATSDTPASISVNISKNGVTKSGNAAHVNNEWRVVLDMTGLSENDFSNTNFTYIFS